MKVLGVEFAKSAIQKLEAARDHLSNQYAEARAERRRLLTALAPAAEQLDQLRGSIQAIGEAYRRQASGEVSQALSGHIDVDPRGTFQGRTAGNLLGAFVPGSPVTIEMLVALCPGEVEKSLAKLIETHAAGSEPGPAMGLRRGLLARVDERLAEIQKAHAALVEEAARSGIVLPPLKDE